MGNLDCVREVVNEVMLGAFEEPCRADDDLNDPEPSSGASIAAKQWC
jgi:hypothetical protein